MTTNLNTNIMPNASLSNICKLAFKKDAHSLPNELLTRNALDCSLRNTHELKVEAFMFIGVLDELVGA